MNAAAIVLRTLDLDLILNHDLTLINKIECNPNEED
jgi:hypothetical protein